MVHYNDLSSLFLSKSCITIDRVQNTVIVIKKLYYNDLSSLFLSKSYVITIDRVQNTVIVIKKLYYNDLSSLFLSKSYVITIDRVQNTAILIKTYVITTRSSPKLFLLRNFPSRSFGGCCCCRGCLMGLDGCGFHCCRRCQNHTWPKMFSNLLTR